MIDILSKDRFSKIIEDEVRESKLSYMETIIWWCDENDMELETAAKLLNPIIKEKLKVEAQNLNFMEKEARLPI